MLFHVPKAIVLALISVTVVACSAADSMGPSAGRFLPDAPPGPRQPTRSTVAEADDGGHRGALQPGTDRFVNATAHRRAGEERAVVVASGERDVELDLVEAGIPRAAQAVLGDARKLNYVVSEAVKGRVTIRTTGPVPRAALLDLFEAALTANGARLERDGEIVKVVAGTSGKHVFRLPADAAAEGASIMVAPLKYVSAEAMVGLLQPLVQDGLTMIPDKRRNLLLLVGNTGVQEAALDALNLFDVDVLLGKSIALIELKSSDPDAIVEELKKIFETEEEGMLRGVVEFVPNKRLGSVLVISSRAQYIDRARRWISELDQTAAGSKLYFQTYPLQHRSARDVAPILSGLLGTGEETEAGTPVSAAAAPTEAPDNLSQYVASQFATADAGAGEGPEAATGTEASGARIVADNDRNALIVRARRADQEEIARLLQELDSPARQVLLEATIAEVTLNDRLGVGVRWFFENADIGFSFSDLASGAVAGTFPGFTAIFGRDVNVALSALADVTEVKVISSPTLVVVDNKVGTLQIGDQVPVATQTAGGLDADSLVLTQVEYRDTGIILNVQPRVGNGGRVTLDITQEVSDVSATRTSGIDSPTISQRKVQTSVVLYDGQTLMLGGLVRENDEKTQSKVPALGDVPVVGALFRRQDSAKERTELIILIRPRIITDELAARAMTEDWRSRLSQTDSILERGLGSPRHTLGDIAR